MSDVSQGPGWWMASDGKWYPPHESAAEATDDGDEKRNLVLATIGGGAVALGSLLPWATFTAPFIGQLEVAGTQGDGKATLALGAAIGVLGVLELTGRGISRVWWVVLGCAALALVVGVYDMATVSDAVSETNASEFVVAQVGVGLYVVIAGALLALIAVGLTKPWAKT